jgi:hypothetical protein
MICVFQVCQVPINTLFPALEELYGHAGYPSASTLRTMAGLKRYEGYSSFTHPLVHLATLEKAEDVHDVYEIVMTSMKSFSYIK